jgi:hypothetical protein
VVCDCLCNSECYPYNGVMYSFVCTVCESMLEADYEVDEPNSFEDDRRTRSSKASGFSLCISICTQVMHIIMFTFRIFS